MTRDLKLGDLVLISERMETGIIQGRRGSGEDAFYKVRVLDEQKGHWYPRDELGECVGHAGPDYQS